MLHEAETFTLLIKNWCTERWCELGAPQNKTNQTSTSSQSATPEAPLCLLNLYLPPNAWRFPFSSLYTTPILSLKLIPDKANSLSHDSRETDDEQKILFSLPPITTHKITCLSLPFILVGVPLFLYIVIKNGNHKYKIARCFKLQLQIQLQDSRDA